MDVDLTPEATESPSVTVLHPNGGESIPVGTQVQVSAHATDDTAVTSVTFSYSSNGGSDWNSIGAGTRVSGTANDGIWNRTWNTNGLDAGSSNYLIRAVASDGTSSADDQSDNTFSLTCTPPSAPTLNDPGTTDTDGNYMVSWSSVSGATTARPVTRLRRIRAVRLAVQVLSIPGPARQRRSLVGAMVLTITASMRAARVGAVGGVMWRILK